jgi:indole-3-glycerol phosphate synthase
MKRFEDRNVMLDEIVETKRREVARQKEAVTLAALEKAVGEIAPARDFQAAIGGTGCAIIAEVKRRSPSRGLLRDDFDPLGIAQEYERHGAAAVSVLTDETFFGGSNADLTAVRGAVALPVLRKEFIIDPYQIHQSRAIGADAVLLIAAILTEARLREFRNLAASLGMVSLIEIHDRKELEKAIAAGAEIIGINNRNLRTFVTDIRTTLELAPLIPRDRIAVSESGIRRREEIVTLSQAGIRAFLIGATLITARKSGAKLEELLGK